MDTNRNETADGCRNVEVVNWTGSRFDSDSGSIVLAGGYYFRIVLRALWLAGELAFALMRFAMQTFIRGIPNQADRARWLQHICRRLIRVFNLQLDVAGPRPTSGLLVCNHLSYLDIVVLGAISPCTFVAKGEVRGWPVFGWFASLAGTVFVRRDQRSEVVRIAAEMQERLGSGALMVLFPEGTTSDGRSVLPFKSSLLEPATRQPHCLSAAFLEYALIDGSVAEEICYWRDMTLGPHLLNLLGKRAVSAQVRFAAFGQPNSDRKLLARQLHAEVVRLKGVSSLCTKP